MKLIVRVLLLIASLLLQAACLYSQEKPSGVTVSGRVIRENQTNQSRIQLIGAGGRARFTNVRSDESFEFANVDPGKYLLIDGQRLTMYPITVVVTDEGYFKS